MKHIKISLVSVALATFGLSSCSDFLDRFPQDAMSGETYFRKDTDLKYYMNGMYSGIIRARGSNSSFIRTWNVGSDDVLGSAPHGSLMRHSISGLANNTSKSWDDAYSYIRKANYFLENAYRVPSTKIACHYIGEGYYCRASKYFDLLTEFGGVPYITKVLTPESPELYTQRMNRHDLAKKIITDLDSAILKLDWKGTGEASSGRINREAALVMKARVALFEGSWEYYHAKYNTPFKVDKKNGTDLLSEVIEAGEQLINRQGSNIFKGNNNNEYYDYFNQLDYTKTEGAYLFRGCNRELGIFDLMLNDFVSGYGGGMTQSAVDAYLMKDGKPSELSNMSSDLSTMNKQVDNKDPRLGQTMWSPNKGRFYDYWPTMTNAYKTSYPGLIQNQQREPAYTGYRFWKFTLKGVTENEDGNMDDLIMRYEEALLSYAEAKAILGTITQEDLDKTINIIRDRVAMAHMKLSEVDNWKANYSYYAGFDPNESNIINEIRREKRVEFMLEGMRVGDLKRWAIYDKVFNGVIPVGARLDEFMAYWNNPEELKKDGFEYNPQNVILKAGVNVDEKDGFINPFFKNSDFKPGTGRGYYINPERDYLSAIPAEEIKLYKDKSNVELEQNPGWF